MKRIIVLIGLLLLSMPGVMAADKEGIRIPVYFVTDRNRIDKGKDDRVEFGNERQYRGICRHDPNMGVAYCVINDIEKKIGKVDMSELGWEKINRKEGPVGITLTAGKEYEDRRKAFNEQVYAACQKVPSPHELDVFVPGYMSTFESGLRSAARLSYYSERPVLLYSWPSKGKLTEYWSDEATIEWSQEHFNNLLADLTDLSERSPRIRVRMYAHSMGGRLVLRATPMLKKNNAFDEIAMICPDVDDGLVKHYASKYFERRGSTIVRLYESNADMMLRLSKYVHGGYPRFGENWEPLDLLTPKTKGSVRVDPDAPASASASNDTDTPDDSTTAAKPGATVSLPKLPPPSPLMRRMQTIDFTKIDLGTLGHRIPVELICSLSRDNEACHGLYFKIEKPKKKQLDPNGPPPDANDGIITVMSNSKWRWFPLSNAIRKYRPRPTLWTTKDWTLK